MKFIDYIEEKFIVFSFVITIVIIALQIIMRAVFNNSLSWSEELARYLFIWECWIGVSFAERYTGQIQIDFLHDILKSKRKKKILLIIAGILTLSISIYLVIIGAKLVFLLIKLGNKSAALRIPMYIIYLSMPLGCFLFSLRKSIKLVTIIKGNE